MECFKEMCNSLNKKDQDSVISGTLMLLGFFCILIWTGITFGVVSTLLPIGLMFIYIAINKTRRRYYSLKNNRNRF